ncbi:MAG TPA: DUF4386 family protein [Ktedonobacteraceae bacterium]|nr:DUF4386 family protein [Ktedonobacteraceae bacterium]
MNLMAKHSQQENIVPEPVYRKLQRAFFALCLLLAPLTLSLSFATCPIYNNPNCPETGRTASPAIVGAAFRDANPLLLQVFFFVTVLAIYLYPLSYVYLGRLAMKRSPWLAISGIVCGFIGSIIWGFLADEFFWINMLAQSNLNAQLPQLQHAYITDGWVYAVHTGWVIGHLFGYVLLGIALLRARAIPRWAAWLLIVSAPIMGPLSYGTDQGLFQVLGYGLIFIASVPAALATLRRPHESQGIAGIQAETSSPT